ncbi:54S ribosomal protein L49, mitochondrial [Candida viswanathii]|uniref:Large ribosomal subunit protein bL21m n=1 Tax=Candida viswanathii TaxID=5486 RepID=A0A367YI25_9ASCO|nr:54S ribosomal protein L49, mitochondrial [Candida viswanathii]
MFRSIIGSTVRPCSVLSTARAYSTAVPAAATASPTAALKFTSNGSRDLYAIMKIHNMPYLVTKGDKVYLPYRLKRAAVGDVLNITDVTTLGTPSYTMNAKEGISPELYDLKASVIEITREPLYQVVRKRQRCRRKKTYNVEPFQTVLRINELKLK